jgi:glycosyltransferase involved in cell wall biosynthesis
MIRAVFAVPGDINASTGGYIYARRILERFAGEGVDARLLTLSAAFPDPDGAAIEDARRQLAALAPDEILLADGLAWGAMPREAIEACRAPIVVLCHHPLFLESGLAPDAAKRLHASEKLALSHARHVIASSATTRDTLVAEFGVPAEIITVAEPGTERAQRAIGGDGGPVRLLAVGAVSQRKAYDVLVEALGPLAGGNWRLRIAGALDRAPEAAGKLRAAIAASPARAQIELAGEVSDSEIEASYSGADVFVLSSLYEGYGMVLAEAMAHGLPVVTTTGGAAAATVPDAASLKVAPGDATALGAALRRMIDDADLRRDLAEQSWQAGQRLPDWNETTRRIAGVLKQTAGMASCSTKDLR